MRVLDAMGEIFLKQASISSILLSISWLTQQKSSVLNGFILPAKSNVCFCFMDQILPCSSTFFLSIIVLLIFLQPGEQSWKVRVSLVSSIVIIWINMLNPLAISWTCSCKDGFRQTCSYYNYIKLCRETVHHPGKCSIRWPHGWWRKCLWIRVENSSEVWIGYNELFPLMSQFIWKVSGL